MEAVYVWARFANAGYLLDSRNTFFCTKQRTHSVINILLFMQQMIFSIRSLHDDLNGGSLDSLCLDNSGFVEDCIIYLKERLMNDSLLIIMIYTGAAEPGGPGGPGPPLELNI